MKTYEFPLPQFARLSEEARERLKRRMEELERQERERDKQQQEKT